MVLAVDAANEPAIRVYAAAGFREFDRKHGLDQVAAVTPNVVVRKRRCDASRDNDRSHCDTLSPRLVTLAGE